MITNYFLICNKVPQNGGGKDVMRTFTGSKLQLISHIEKINNGNYSYIITNFKT